MKILKNHLNHIYQIFVSTPKSTLLIILVDFIIIGLAVGRSFIHWLDLPYYGFFVNDFLSITEDWKLGEVYQYLKEIAIVSIMFFLILKSKSYISWGVLYLYVLFDDALGIHEKIGSLFEKLPDMIPSILSNENMGELLGSVGFGTVILGGIIFAYFKSPANVRINFHILMFLFMLLIFFGVFIDIFVSKLFDSRILSKAVHFLEESGEMISISLTLWFIIGLFLQEKNNAEVTTVV